MRTIKIDMPRYQAQLIVNNKINIIQGASGTGKSLLSYFVGMLTDPCIADDGSSVHVYSFREMGYSNAEWALKNEQGAVFIIDEDDKILAEDAGLNILRSTSNYLIITARDSFSKLPYGIDDIFVLEGTPSNTRMRRRYTIPELCLR